MSFLIKLSSFMIFSAIFGNILTIPLLGEHHDVVKARGASSLRPRRQVVQPGWIPNSGISLFDDFNVRVTDEKLEETEAIREHIQETVDNGTYEVDLDEGDFEENASGNEEEMPPPELPEPGPELEVEPEPEHQLELQPGHESEPEQSYQPEQKSQPEQSHQPEQSPQPKQEHQPEQEPQPGQKSHPVPEPAPKQKQNKEVQSTKAISFAKKFKFGEKFESVSGSGSFFIWLKKMFNRS